MIVWHRHLDDAHATLDTMVRTKVSALPGHIQAVYAQNIGKLYAQLTLQAEQADDWDAVYTLDNLLLSKLPLFEQTEHLEAQERVSYYSDSRYAVDVSRHALCVKWWRNARSFTAHKSTSARHWQCFSMASSIPWRRKLSGKCPYRKGARLMRIQPTW